MRIRRTAPRSIAIPMPKAERYRRFRIIALLIGTLVALLAITSLARAQDEFDVVPFADKYKMPKLMGFESPDQASTIKRQMRDVESLRKDDRKAAATGLASGNRAPADEYFQGFLFPYMTQNDDAVLSTFGEFRNDFMKDFLSTAINGANRSYLVEQLMLPNLKKIAEGNYHPSARLNAVILIGSMDLNDETPQPSGECAKYLVGMLGDSAQPDYLRVGALSGLHRIAEIVGYRGNLDPNEVTKLSDFCLAVADGKSPGQDTWDKDVNEWITRRCIQVLGNLRAAGQGGSVLDALNIVVRDQNRPIWVRADAVEAIGKIAAKVPSIPNDLLVRSIDNSIAFAGDALEEEAVSVYRKVEEYVARALLFDDIYLVDPTGKMNTGANPGGDPGGQGRGGGGKMGGGAGKGGMGGIGAGNFDGETGGSKEEAFKSEFDLPNYALNMFRRRVKGLMFYAGSALVRLNANSGLSDRAAQGRVADAIKIMQKAVEDANAGMKDLKTDEVLQANNMKEGVSDFFHDQFQLYAAQLRALAPRAEAQGETPAGASGAAGN